MDKFEVCFAAGTKEDWSWELLKNDCANYTEALENVEDGAGIGSGYAIFKNGVRILPDAKEAHIELKNDRHNVVANAMAIIHFTMDGEYDFYCYHLTEEEMEDEKKRVASAWKVLDEKGIVFDKTVHNKREARWKNIMPAPVRFIDRERFTAVEVDELPF